MKNQLILFLFFPIIVFCQLGINTPYSNSTLTVEGSFEASYKEFSTARFAITDTDHYLSYVGNSNSNVILPVIGIGTRSYTGRIYKIKNLSNYSITLFASSGNTLRSHGNPVSSFLISPSGYVEVVKNSSTSGGTWDLSFIGNTATGSNVDIYGNQLKIPPHTWGSVQDFSNHSTTAYDTPATTSDAAWWVIGKTSIPPSSNRPARMTIVYEYQGTPFDVVNISPILTMGNNTIYPDVFSASFISLANNGIGGKTRLTVSLSRVDNFSNGWGGTFSLNILLARKP